MSNYKSSTSSTIREDLTIEVVQPDDGRQESFWVMLFISVVILVGALGVWSRQQPTIAVDPSEILSLDQRQLFLELSIAVEEIHFMGDVVTDGEITLSDLIQQSVLPVFTGQTMKAWRAINNACFLLPQPNSNAAFALWIDGNSHSAVFFTSEMKVQPSACSELSTWIRMDKN